MFSFAFDKDIDIPLAQWTPTEPGRGYKEDLRLQYFINQQQRKRLEQQMEKIDTITTQFN